MNARTHRQMPEMEALKRSDTLRELPTRVPSDEFVEMQKAPGGFFVMMFWTIGASLMLWALLVMLFSVVTP